MTDTKDTEREALLPIAKAIIGPWLPVPEGSKWSLEQLRDRRWSGCSKAEQSIAINAARAVRALTPDHARQMSEEVERLILPIVMDGRRNNTAAIDTTAAIVAALRPSQPSDATPPSLATAEVREALAWYGEQARLARLVHSEGDAGRHALADDGGKRANEVLARHPQPPSLAPDADRVLVPREPTAAMIRAYYEAPVRALRSMAETTWSAMIAAAPATADTDPLGDGSDFGITPLREETATADTVDVGEDCPSCHGLNLSCPDGCGRDPETGELNGTALHTPPQTETGSGETGEGR